MRLPVEDPRLLIVARAWGTPYVYGAGAPKDAARPDWWLGGTTARPGAPPGVRGFDCGGIVQVLSALTGGPILPTDEDRGVAGLWEVSRLLQEGDAEFGDLAFYGRPGAPAHVMFCLGGGALFGACSGTSSTYGQDARAFCDFRRVRYWAAAFVGIRRLEIPRKGPVPAPRGAVPATGAPGPGGTSR